MKHTHFTHPDYVPTAKFKELKKKYDYLMNRTIPHEFNEAIKALDKCIETMPDSQEEQFMLRSINTNMNPMSIFNDSSICSSTKTPGPGKPQDKLVSAMPSSCRSVARTYRSI